MAIPLIPAIAATPASPALFGANAAGAAAPSAASPAGAAGFQNSLLSVVDNADAAISRSGELGQQAATGQLRNVHDYMIASAEASSTLEMTVALKNEALRAFQTVMNTPV